MPRSFLAALLAALEAAPSMTSIVPGGFWHRKIPPNNPLPAVIFVITVARDRASGGKSYVQKGQLDVWTYARLALDASSISDRVAFFLTDIDDTLNLSWTNGRLMELRPDDDASPQLPNPGPAASWVQSESVVFRFVLQSAYVPATSPQNPT